MLAYARPALYAVALGNLIKRWQKAAYVERFFFEVT
jgi:hypothetical protein